MPTLVLVCHGSPVNYGSLYVYSADPSNESLGLEYEYVPNTGPGLGEEDEDEDQDDPGNDVLSVLLPHRASAGGW